MSSYLSVLIQERDISNNKLDSSIIIIYEGKEEIFYLYGRRGVDEVYESYSYSYHYSELNELCHFIKLIVNHEKSTISIDYNNIFIPYKDLDYVDFDYLKNKINRNNEIIAFDFKDFKSIHLKKNLKKLFCIGKYL